MPEIGEDLEESYTLLYRKRLYEDVTAESELFQRPGHENGIRGQASFLALAVLLDLPILGYGSNSSGGNDRVLTGRGASYQVSRAYTSLVDSTENFPLTTKLNGRLFGQSTDATALKTQRYVVKRIKVQSSLGTNDAKTLAAITNEIRILANEALREGQYTVRMLCLAWDELPTQGRFWPRLLLESADHGNLLEYLQHTDDGLTWRDKMCLGLDVLCGLKELHLHNIAHCDLKLENVLVFTRDQDGGAGERDIKSVKAKLCDFGFSVIMSDYEEGATIDARLGTEPWNAPELTFGRSTHTSDLYLADLFSFGLLLSRIFQGGSSPFEGLSHDEIRELKRLDTSSTMKIYNTVKDHFLSTSKLGEEQNNALDLLFIGTLSPNPTLRFPIHILSAYMCFMLQLYSHNSENEHPGREQDAVESLGSDLETVEAQSPHEMNAENENSDTYPESPSTRFWRTSKAFLRLLDPIKLVFESVARMSTNAGAPSIRYVLRRMGYLKNPYEELLKPLPVGAIRIPKFVQSSGEAQKWESYGKLLLPDFEDTRSCLPWMLHPNTLSEVFNDLLNQADQDMQPDVELRREANYQIGLAYFHGYGTAKDPTLCLEWLGKAAKLDHQRALAGLINIHQALGHGVPKDLETLYNNRIQDLAIDDLRNSAAHLLNNNLEDFNKIIAIQGWVDLKPSEYQAYIMSREFRRQKLMYLHIWNTCFTPEKEDKPGIFDFTITPKCKMSMQDGLEENNESVVMQEIRAQRCLESFDFTGLTLLQKAAANGDIRLAKLLIHRFKAKVDNIGNTEGLTPLWISAFCGDWDMMRLLLREKADITIRDRRSQRNVLHFLHQFTTADEIMCIIEEAAKAGLFPDAVDKRGQTPLISTFIGWDLSRGLAAQILLRSHSDPLHKSQTLASPLNTCFRALDTSLLNLMLEDLNSPSAQARLQDSKASIVEEKTIAYGAFLQIGKFSYLLGVGKSHMERQRQFLALLLDAEVRICFEKRAGTTLLSSACYMDNEFLLKTILDLSLELDINEPGSGGNSPLQWAIERHNYACVKILWDEGADLFATNDNNHNAAHTAAIHFPWILSKLVEVCALRGDSVSELLGARESGGFTPYALAVVEGTRDHLQYAEALRRAYDIDHDTRGMNFAISGRKNVSLTGWLVGSASYGGTVTTSQFSYMIGLHPIPNFVCGDMNVTLLHLAVIGFQFGDRSSNLAGYEVLKTVLNTYGTPENVHMKDASGLTALHIAAFFADYTAIEIIKEYMDEKEQHLDLNALDGKALTPLSYTGSLLKSYKVDQVLDRLLLDTFKEKSVRTFHLLRSMGARASVVDDRGIDVAVFARLQSEMSRFELQKFLGMASREHDLTWELHEDENYPPAELYGTEEVSWVIRILWLYDHFGLRAHAAKTGNLPRVFEDLFERRREILQGETKYPWTTLDCVGTFHKKSVRWQRPGRIWTFEQREELISRITVFWTETFREGYVMGTPRRVTLDAEIKPRW